MSLPSLIKALALWPLTAVWLKRDPVKLGRQSLRGFYLQYGIDPLGVPLDFSDKLSRSCYTTTVNVARFHKLAGGKRTGLVEFGANFANQLEYNASILASYMRGDLSWSDLEIRSPEMIACMSQDFQARLMALSLRAQH